jgi:two-component system phosphate regulon sensor histidine kinase PhoR
LTPKIYTGLLGLFVLLLAFYTAAMELLAHRLMGREAQWLGAIALAVTLVFALVLAGWVAFRVSGRLRQVVAFARRIAEGDLSARLDHPDKDELSAMEAALNQTAERLGQSFAEIESRRQELAAMLDSMQEAVIAITGEGLVRWSNAVMQRMAGAPIHVGRPLVHSVRDPDVLACVQGALAQGEVRFGRASSLAPGRIFEINAAPLPSGGALVVLHDVTRIEAAEKSRRDFISNVSHELRTPLT